MSNKFKSINNFIEGKTFEYDHNVRFNLNHPVKAYYQFHIEGIKPLISVGEWTDHLFVSVKLVNGEGMVNFYLSSYADKKYVGRQNVTNYWFEFYVQISEDIEDFLKFFSIDLPVVIDNFEFSPSKDYVSLLKDFEKPK